MACGRTQANGRTHYDSCSSKVQRMSGRPDGGGGWAARLRTVSTSRPAAAMAVATATSRATGLVRTVALAWALGLGSLSDAYNVANTVPTMLFTLVVGGPLAASLVPLLTAEGPGEQRRVAGALFFVVVVASSLAGVVLAAAAPVVVRTLTVGGSDAPDHAAFADLATRWLLLFAVQVPLYGISTFATGVLTAHSRLALAAAAPVLTNLVATVAAVAFRATGAASPSAVEPAGFLILGVGTSVSVGVMAAVQLWGARRVVPGLRPVLDLRHPVVRALPGLAGWVVLYVGVNQVGLAVVTSLASSVEGGISAYQWAFAVMQLPYAIAAVSVISAMTPHLARAREGDVGALVSRSVGRVARLMAPAAAVLAITAGEMATLLVGDDGPLLAHAIRGFAVSLVPFSLFQVLTRACYARRDTRSPALVNVGVNFANVAVAAVVLIAFDVDGSRIFGLALSHALSYAVGCALLTRIVWAGSGVRVWRGDGAVDGVAVALAIVGVVVGLTGVETAAGRPDSAVLLAVRSALSVVVVAVVAAGARPAMRRALRGASDRWRPLQ